MGLSMYAFVTEEAPAKSVDFDVADPRRLHYWRKHPDLHGWMEDLYREKGGTDGDFNGVNVQLVAEDLDRLEADMKAKRLPHTEGFFFGASDGSELPYDLQFIQKARDALSQKLTVFYTSCW